MKKPWWQIKPLQEMSNDEWEQVCDRCGKCCLIKLQDEDEDGELSGEVYYTDVACHLFDSEHCKCADYKNRQLRVPDCVQLSPTNLSDLEWMPPSCSYRLLYEGKSLPGWHHLNSGSFSAIHEAGASVIGKVVFEREIEEELEERIVEWPIIVN